MDTTRIPYNRAAALAWWKPLSFIDKKLHAEQWQAQLTPGFFKKEWSFDMIYYSDSTIEEIFTWIHT